MHHIERLTAPATPADIRSLAELILDAVDSGAAVSFLDTLTRERAEEWWTRTVATVPIILVARDREGIAGSVQLHPAWAPNQPHRAEVCKLLVHRRARKAGLGTELMRAVERVGRESGFTLLTLDAKRGGPAHALYEKLGWITVGVIPRYALDTDGKAFHDDVIFYKEVGEARGEGREA